MICFEPILAALFLAPALAWAAAGLVGVPIVIHLLNRRRHKVLRWAAMEYLLEAMRQNRRRLRLQDLVLLTLRCAAIALVALALSRPLACAPGAAGRLLGQQSSLHVLVVDNSGSMNYRADRPGAVTQLDQARRLAKSLIARMESGQDAVAIVTTAGAEEGGGAKVQLAPSYDLAAAGQAMDAIAGTDARTDLAGALEKAAEIARRETMQTQRTLEIFTDAAQHAWQGPPAERLKSLGQQLAGQYRITHFNLGNASQSNAAVTALAPSAGVSSTAIPADFAATARYFGRQEGRFSLQWSLGQQVAAVRENVALSADTPPQLLSQVVLPSPGPLVVAARLIPEDRLPQDDARFAAVEVVSGLKVLVVEGDRGSTASGSANFLELALAPSSAAGASKPHGPVTLKAISDLEFSSQALSDYHAVVLANVPRLSAEQAQRLKQFVLDGGSAILFMGENVAADAWNTELLPLELLPGRLMRRLQAPEGGEPYRFSFRPAGALHPLLSVFRGEEKSGLATARIFTYYQLALPATTRAQRVLDFTSGDPAIVLQHLGAGRVVFVATSADSRWTTLPAKPAYVALLHEILLGTVNAGEQWMNHVVGERLLVPSRVPMSGAPRLLDPSGAAVPLSTAPHGGQASSPLWRVGLYRLETGLAVIPVAVDFPPEESDVRWLTSASIREALGGVPMTLAGDELPGETAVEAPARDLGWSLLAAATVLLCMEGVLAMWFRRGSR